MSAKSIDEWKGEDRGFQGFGGGKKSRGEERMKKKNTEPIINSIESWIAGREKKQTNKNKERKWMLREYTKEIGKNKPICMI